MQPSPLTSLKRLSHAGFSFTASRWSRLKLVEDINSFKLDYWNLLAHYLSPSTDPDFGFMTCFQSPQVPHTTPLLCSLHVAAWISLKSLTHSLQRQKCTCAHLTFGSSNPNLHHNPSEPLAKFTISHGTRKTHIKMLICPAPRCWNKLPLFKGIPLHPDQKRSFERWMTASTPSCSNV